jgi:hypothetical protein
MKSANRGSGRAGTTFHFVNDGPESALAQAKASAAIATFASRAART